jgi:hypothetical protein
MTEETNVSIHAMANQSPEVRAALENLVVTKAIVNITGHKHYGEKAPIFIAITELREALKSYDPSLTTTQVLALSGEAGSYANECVDALMHVTPAQYGYRLEAPAQPTISKPTKPFSQGPLMALRVAGDTDADSLRACFQETVHITLTDAQVAALQKCITEMCARRNIESPAR